MDKFSSAWKSSTPCEGCSMRFSVFRRKKPCFSCKNYFCQVCIMRRPDKKMCCRKCQILTATPLVRNDLLNLRSRDLVNYLASRHISTSGCVEKEDLVNVLMRTVNNTSSSAENSASNSGNNSYSNSPGKNSVSSDQPDSKRKPPQMHENVFTDDGIRIKGTDLPEGDDGSSSSSNNSNDSEMVNDSDWVVVNENNEEAERQEETIPSNIGDTIYNTTETEIDITEAEVAGSHSKTKEMNLKRDNNKTVQLSDISCSADLDNLSVKELKKLLMTNRTDFKGCIERAELIEKASRLWSDYTLSRKDLEKLSLEELCKICMDAPIECVLLECGHMAACMSCGKQLSECPVCRQFVVRCVRTFKV